MLHARSDYQRFQDPAGKIGEDEPVMLFRAQDRHFISVLHHYLELLAADPGCDIDIQMAVLEHINRAADWRSAHKVKSPDLPK